MLKRSIYMMTVFFLAMLLWQCGRGPESMSSDMSRRLAMMPASDGLVYVNLDQIRASDFYQLFLDSLDGKMNHDRRMSEFIEVTGVDPRKDVQEIYAAVNPGKGSGEERFLAVVIGRYDPEKVIRYIEENDQHQKLAREDYNGLTLFSDAHGNGPSFAFVDNRQAVVGSREWVKSWLDQNKSGKGGNAANRDLATDVKYKNGAWMVLNAGEMVDEFMNEMGRSPEVRRFSALEAIEKVNLSFSFTDRILMDGSGRFTDAANAELFRDAVKGLLAAAKLTVSGDRDAVDVINKIDISTDKNQVRINTEMTRRDLEKMIRQRHKGMARHF